MSAIYLLDSSLIVTRTRVRKGHAQGHVTLSYKATLDSYSVGLYLFDIRDPKNLQNKKDHRSCVIRTRDSTNGHAYGHVTLTYKVTRDGWCVELYVFDIPGHKTCKTKKNHRSCVIRTRYTKGHVHGHKKDHRFCVIGTKDKEGYV